VPVEEPSTASKPDSCSATSCQLLDHLVGGSEERWWHGETERSGSLQIDDQLKFGRLLNRQIAGFLALEDAVDVGTRAPIKVKIVDAVRRKTSSLSIVTKRKNRR
jgi:hypothetical protein